VRFARLHFIPSLLGLLASPIAAQQHWSVAVELGSASFNGHASSTATTPETTGHPSPARTWGIRLGRDGGKVGYSLGVLVASTGVQFESDENAAEARDILGLLEVSPQVAFVILKPREAAFRLHLGGVLDYWSPEGDNARTSLGLLGALSLDVPFSSRFGAEARWETMVTGSVFEDDELPAEFDRKSGWSERWVIGVKFIL
jgi:hypothetical protein